MPFGMVSAVGFGIGVLDFGGDRRRGRGSMGGEFVAFHCMGTLLYRCVEMRKVIELSFGLVSGVGSGIHALDGSPRASRGRGSFWHGFRYFSKI